jgi:hypothetical protein
LRNGLLAAALLCGVAIPAHAGTIVITITTATGACAGGACTKTFTDTDANLAKILTAYAPGCQASNGNVACTTPQTIVFALNDIVNYIKVTTNNALDAVAAAAVVLPTPINPQ